MIMNISSSPESELAPGISSLPEALSLAISWIDGDDAASPAAAIARRTPLEEAVALLIRMQAEISRRALFSTNEALDDVPTPSLGLLGVDYQLGRAYLALPTHAPPPAADGSTSNGGSDDGPSPSLSRKRNITRAMEYYHSFLKRLEQLGEDMLSEATRKEYHAMLDLEDLDDSAAAKKSSRTNPSQIREMKIQRFQRKKSMSQKRTQLQSQLQRRSRLGLAGDEPLEGHDLESLTRTLHVETLRMHAEESLEEMQSSRGELEMLEMALKMEGARMRGADPRMIRNGGGRGAAPMPQAGMRPPPNGKPPPPLQMTQITQNPLTGQLEFAKQRVSNGRLQPVAQTIRRQEIADGVFRPGWNQPTMTLAELGERERAEAIARGEAQKVAEAEAKLRPRRYEQLVKDGMEDDDKLVEASAKLDREWDDWKEENPRGSGNKMAERGDRNF